MTLPAASRQPLDECDIECIEENGMWMLDTTIIGLNGYDDPRIMAITEKLRGVRAELASVLREASDEIAARDEMKTQPNLR